MQKGFLLIWILVGVLVGGAIIFTTAKLKPQSTPPSKTSTTPIPSPVDASPVPTGTDETANPDSIGANWKTYTNTKYRYTFKYPNSQDINESDNPIENYTELLNSVAFYGINEEVDFIINTWSNLGILIKDAKTRDMWCKSIIERQPENLLRNALSCLEATPTYVNSMQAFLSKGATDNSYLNILHIAYGNYVYELTITTGKNYPQATFAISNQILSTFKFL